MEEIRRYIDLVARVIEATGVAVIIVGACLALFRFLVPDGRTSDRYKTLRQNLGKAILLGLEILVAADIIATVVTQPTMASVLTLGVIVLIRTFLSLSLQVEIEGRFPWQEKAGDRSPQPPAA
jgi:uncharacterized membrane protein